MGELRADGKKKVELRAGCSVDMNWLGKPVDMSRA